MTTTVSTPGPLARSRGFLTGFGIFSILAGIFAIAFPLAASVAIEQVVGIVLVVSGVLALGAVIFGSERNHRIATTFLSLIRIAAGLVLLVYIKPGVLTLTVVLSLFFFAEGVTFLISALALRHNRAWPLILVNGLVALVLAAMIFLSLPSSAAWAVGLLYGINSVFYGVALLGFAAGHRTET